MTMSRGWGEKLSYLGVGILIVAGVVYAWLPAPVLVDVQPVARGRLEVAVEDDGQTRIKEKYIISAPVAGRLSRVQLHPGDQVVARETVLTTLNPTAPALLDKRSKTEAESRLKLAEATRIRAEPLLAKAREKVRVTEEEYLRIQKLFENKTLTQEARDRARFEFRSAQEEQRAAEVDVQIAEFEVDLAKAGLIHTQERTDANVEERTDWLIDIRSPICGRVLRVLQESSAVVAAGTPLLEVGDPQDLEIVIDVLSNDAVKVKPGNPVIVSEWGGDVPLQAHVRLVEPSGFTKISALGIEEKRVNVIIDFDTPFEKRPTLGDEFRIEARIIVDLADDVLLVPTGALFQDEDSPAVYVVANGRAQLRHIKTGRRGRFVEEVNAGLVQGETVIVYPSDKIRAGILLKVR